MSMNCMYCNKSVVGHNPVTIPGHGFQSFHWSANPPMLKRPLGQNIRIFLFK